MRECGTLVDGGWSMREGLNRVCTVRPRTSSCANIKDAESVELECILTVGAVSGDGWYIEGEIVLSWTTTVAVR